MASSNLVTFAAAAAAIVALQIILVVQATEQEVTNNTTDRERQFPNLLGPLPDLLGGIGNLFGFGRRSCPEYARNDCRQICQPNDFQLNCEGYPERPATCMCFCPSLQPLFTFCDRQPSSYCTVPCGRGGLGHRCVGPSGSQQCACFCPLNRDVYESQSDIEPEFRTEDVYSNGTRLANKTEPTKF